ncbi:MAG TPA: limonene-1,2-epoxide hydrolase family protein, partial [Candidatus Binataceae bacterium]|nr:limonene-1,2-epoxide hydrolase family protein [Candidatus Binataceae bacterium]
DGVMSRFAENAVWDNVPMNAPAKGSSAIREMMNGFLKDASGFEIKVLKSCHVGNVVFNERVDTIRMKNGKSAAIPVAGVFELNDAGQITAWRDYFDLATYTKQIA